MTQRSITGVVLLFESVLGAEINFSFRFDNDQWDGGNRTLWDYMFYGGGDNGDGGDSGDVQGSAGGEGEGVSCFSRSDSEEKRGGNGEAGVGSRASSPVSSICTSPFTVSQGNSSSNKLDAGGHITASTGAGGGGWGSVLRTEAGVGGRSVGTSKLDDTSNPIGGSTKGDGVDCHVF